MSKTSTRSGRTIKVKHNSDTENGNKNCVSVSDVTTPLSKTANKQVISKRISMEEKSSSNSDSYETMNQQDLIKCSVKLSYLPLSVNKDKADSKSMIDDGQILASAPECEPENSPVIAAKQKDNGTSETPAPLSAVRRSSRAPVPSSRYKDMELDLKKVKKRLNTFEDSEAETERIKKRKKTSDKTVTDIEDVLPMSTNSTSIDVSSKTPIVLVDRSISITIDNLNHCNVVETDHDKKKTSPINTGPEPLEIKLVEISESEISTMEQNSDIKPSHETKLNVIGGGTKNFQNFRIEGQHVTITKEDGDTVAIVNIPSSPLKEEIILQEHSVQDSSPQEHAITFEDVDSGQGLQTLPELVTVNPTVHNLAHVIKRDMVDAPFATVVGEDGATYLNLSVEATNIHSILKGKHVVKAPNPVKGHGRVLRNPAGSMIMKTSIIPPKIPKSDVLDVKPPVTFSLLSQKKTQLVHNVYSVPRSVTMPASVTPTQENQLSQQRIVIKQDSLQDSALPEVTTETQPNDSTVTVINFSNAQPNKTITVSALATVDTKFPKTASEILLQKLKLQPKITAVEEINQASDNVLNNATTKLKKDPNESDDDTNQPVTGTDEHKVQISKIEDSHYILSLDAENSSSVKAANMNCGEDFSLVTVRVDLQQDNEFKNLAGGDTKSAHVNQEDYIESKHESETSSKGISISEESNVLNTIYNSTENQTISVQENTATKVIKENVASETASGEDDTEEQKTFTKLVSLAHLSDLANASVSRDKEHFIEKIRVVDNGVEYDVRIVSEEEVAEEIIDSVADHILQNDDKHAERNTAEVEPQIVIKQEIDDENGRSEVEKQTSGTQTVYSPHVQNATSLSGANAATTHTLATVVDEGAEKKHVYYVSVIPNKGIMAKSKTSMYSSAASWIINDNGMYCCEKCDYQTDRKANFYKHRRSHTGSKPHVCSVCQYKAGTSSNLKRHMGIHKDIREHKCDTCNLSFRQKIHLERHIKYKHEEKSIKCPMCDYICANEQPDLKMHIKRKHSTESSGEVVICPECKAQVGSRKDFKQHMKFHRDGPELKLFCKECSFVTDCQSRLKRHTAIHSKMKPFQCGICNYRAAQKEHVLRHLRTQHKIDIKRDGKRPWKRHKKMVLDDGAKERADFTSGDKIFACNHCTMRFAKLINLYKHLHTQHGDIMPAETDGNFFCVVCEFSTTNKKNLLVHMRRHNMTDQTPPTHVYSCVLCRYVNPRRRNLFQHMRKKHNINISRQAEGMDGDDDGESQEFEVSDIIGSVNRALTSNNNTVSVSTAEATESTSREMGGELTTGVASVIKIEDLTQMAGSEDNEEAQALVIDNRPSDVAEALHVTTHAADAVEGLQALAEQAGLIESIIEEQVSVIDEQQTLVIEQSGSTAEVVTTSDSAGDQLQHIIQSDETLSSTSAEMAEGLELSEDQISSLRNGDMVEMDGHLYLVELSQDPSNPHKQVVSFLPVTTTTININNNNHATHE